MGAVYSRARPRQGSASARAEVHVGECLPEGAALHRGREYNRGTGCGKTARPGLHGGRRVTGVPTVGTAAGVDKGKMVVAALIVI